MNKIFNNIVNFLDRDFTVKFLVVSTLFGFIFGADVYLVLICVYFTVSATNILKTIAQKQAQIWQNKRERHIEADTIISGRSLCGQQETVLKFGDFGSPKYFNNRDT